jgi:hypothetical protein
MAHMKAVRTLLKKTKAMCIDPNRTCCDSMKNDEGAGSQGFEEPNINPT